MRHVPAAGVPAEDREFDAIVRRVQRRERAAHRVRALGAVYLGLSGLVALAAAGVLAATWPWAFLSGDPSTAAWLGGLGTALAGVLLLAALPGLLAGVGLLRFRPWGRALALGLGVLALLQVPFGTVLGALTLYVLLQGDSDALFGGKAPLSPWRRSPSGAR